MRIYRILAAAVAVLAATGASAATPVGALYGDKPGTPDLTGVWYHLSKPGSVWAPVPKFKGKYAADYQRHVDAEKAGKPLADLGARCMPSGMPNTLLLSGYPTEIIQTPGRVTVIKENLSQVLRIWTDGRPQEKDPDPTFFGHSVGHWEGDSLVVDTFGIRDETQLDAGRTMPHSTKLHLTERFRKSDPKTLEVKITAEDPEAFEGKTEVTSYFQSRNDYEVMEHVCEAPGFDITPDGAIAGAPAAPVK